MKTTVAELVDKANQAVKTYSVAEARELLNRDNVIFIDVRDEPEIARDGKIPRGVNISRGMLEFRIDSESPYHNPIFSQQKEFVFYCASGGRSALAAQRAKEMGLNAVAHVGGGFKAWLEAAQPTEKSDD